VNCFRCHAGVNAMLREKYLSYVRRKYYDDDDDDDDDDDRRKRSISTEAEENTIHHREKRRIFGNPCVYGKPMKTTIIFGIDSDNGEVVELFQDPSKFCYVLFATSNRNVTEANVFFFFPFLFLSIEIISV